ncbi:hypothetical protein JKP88DRAFT_287151 [Tribonema minus]|uniref:Uncharacterized protein n=1 Tax=Tribonema minus TaxID=303371 RepID=A0A835ZEH0_9STRA|nr:hypothetical protein JKP88DRAFT_287151 [Tribonema minus]
MKTLALQKAGALGMILSNKPTTTLRMIVPRLGGVALARFFNEDYYGARAVRVSRVSRGVQALLRADTAQLVAPSTAAGSGVQAFAKTSAERAPLLLQLRLVAAAATAGGGAQSFRGDSHKAGCAVLASHDA